LERNRFRKTIKQILRGRKLKRFAKRFEVSDEHEEERAERLGVEKDVNESKAVRVFEQIRDPR
jgi:hypothetical protein